MIYALGNLPIVGIYVFGVVQRKLGHIYHMRRSWTQGHLTVYLKGILRGIEALGFTVPSLKA